MTKQNQKLILDLVTYAFSTGWHGVDDRSLPMDDIHVI